MLLNEYFILHSRSQPSWVHPLVLPHSEPVQGSYRLGTESVFESIYPSSQYLRQQIKQCFPSPYANREKRFKETLGFPNEALSASTITLFKLKDSSVKRGYEW